MIFDAGDPHGGVVAMKVLRVMNHCYSDAWLITQESLAVFELGVGYPKFT